ncbi:formylglycine-generating enzyme family protein [Nitrosomonas sp.]|uniref:formylglycine-generating enzyme family protein n=1 Tax=Nitrosomonas sp. TaxID=42353 RepID=UPI00261F3BF8|nr:formylglycine-generating enzyme family protein [Nitrosomonas sp.]
MDDIHASLRRLDSLAALLHAEGMSCGPDVWLSVYRLLDHLKRQSRLPKDIRQLAPVLGPLFCRNPEDQARFPVLFEQWLAMQDEHAAVKGDEFTLAAVNQMTSPKQTTLAAVRSRVQKTGKVWLAAILAFIITLIAVLMVWVMQPDPTAFDQGPKPPKDPEKIIANDTDQPIQEVSTVPIIDQVVPRSQPEPQRLSDYWKMLLAGIAQVLFWLPWGLAFLWLAKRYHQHWILNSQPASGDDLLSQLRFERVLTPIFGGAKAEHALRDLRAARFELTQRLDVAATVQATARSGGYFHPIYRNRRVAPEHLLLVRSLHRNDQQAALAEELEKRFVTLGLQVRTYRFRDDPRWLVRWHAKDENNNEYYRLPQLLARHGDARLLIISETDILFHPYSGEIRSWLKEFAPWQDKVWLHPRDAGVAHATLLAQRNFLMLPLARDSLPQLVEHLTTEQPAKFIPQPAYPLLLPDMIAAEPDAWLREKPPYGADLSQLVRQLEFFLGSYGLRLLRAVAVYPKPHWALTQALDYLLFGHLNTANVTADPPQRREQRLARISRLPWLTHVHLPDWLREYLLLGMEREERQRITAVWQRLFGQLTDKSGLGTLNLEVRTPSKRQLRIRLAELRAMKNADSFNDPIFANILLGGKLGLLDFRLPQAMARLLPRASQSLILRPALIVILCAAIGGWGLHAMWNSYGQQALTQFQHYLKTQEYAQWQVNLHYQQGTQALAEALRNALQSAKFPVTLQADTIEPAAAINTIQYAAGGKSAAERAAHSLAWLTYDADVKLSVSATLPADAIQVQLSQTYQHAAGFNDELRFLYQAESSQAKLPFEPEMVRIPPGKFLMGSPENESGRYSDEGPQHEVTIAYAFEISKYEVTFDEYDAFAKDAKRQLPSDEGWGRGKRPVINVSWKDARDYVQWLSKQTGKKYRLPTEAEWEYAARARTQTAYWWGPDIGKNNANCRGCGSEWDGKQTAPADSFNPNTFGLHNTAGNVWEWIEDCSHDNYQGAPADGSAWKEANGGDCGRRVVRGGSWFGDPQLLRSAGRGGAAPVLPAATWVFVSPGLFDVLFFVLWLLTLCGVQGRSPCGFWFCSHFAFLYHCLVRCA